ncbi:hypothetical protein PPTG_18006 [Phytophthora nicotianae INRA-310]|uniref:Uncharacterized protein n=1 Tax=Phytophthora nicotianae (strain INRA-310) TaxID=761204 RepID=W2PHR5_PHYN3|nr:hypothetical protein PPTG_18006 [Phytophthora nicotianae INRA-310]ETN00563.1 hypothetical protein PPTG_18006 [Phytophthora nicotianae INRA-310]
MAPKPTLPACGYIVADLGLPQAMVDELLSEAKARTYVPVFKMVAGDDDDGLRQQSQPRQDYPNEVIATAAKKKTGRIPASAIFALDEGTILRAFSGGFTTRDDTKACEVRIPVGYCIIFRGDLIPNGMPYAATNHQIHCYLS